MSFELIRCMRLAVLCVLLCVAHVQPHKHDFGIYAAVITATIGRENIGDTIKTKICEPGNVSEIDCKRVQRAARSILPLGPLGARSGGIGRSLWPYWRFLVFSRSSTSAPAESLESKRLQPLREALHQQGGVVFTIPAAHWTAVLGRQRVDGVS